MEPDLPWRVQEVPEDAGVPPAPGSRPLGSAPPDARRRVALAALGATALITAAVAALLVVAGPQQGTLVLDGDAARPAGTGATAGSFAPDTALVAGQGLVIDVAGAVLRPGVYHLPVGSRIADAIAAAGGFGPRVDALAAQTLNLAAPLADGVQVRVPSRDDATSRSGESPGTGSGATSGSGAASGRPIDLNTATTAELDTLPGIGPVTAGKIIASREERPFSAVADLQTRKLVGPSTFAKLASLVTVGGR